MVLGNEFYDRWLAYGTSTAKQLISFLIVFVTKERETTVDVFQIGFPNIIVYFDRVIHIGLIYIEFDSVL